MGTLSIGTISQGTLITSEIIEAILDEMKLLKKDDDAKAFVEKYTKEAASVSEEHEAELLAEMEDEIHEFLPPYTYFGTIEGDGAHIGVFPDLDHLEMDRQDGEVIDADSASDGHNGVVVEVNDHGNMSLYMQKGSERSLIWDVV
jgi:hypothetical protein